MGNKLIRRPRAAFTKTLYAIVERCAAAQPHMVVDYKDYYHHYRETHDINAVWVAGSYARGAVECGDLDVIVDARMISKVVLRDEQPKLPSLLSAIVGRAHDVQLIVGTPEKNDSGIAHSNAILVWSPALPDYRAAIDAIKVDHTVTRHERRSDLAPLGPERCGVGPQTLEAIVEFRQRGEIDWEWRNASVADMNRVNWSSAARKLYDFICRAVGRVPSMKVEVMGHVIANLDARRKMKPRKDNLEEVHFQVMELAQHGRMELGDKMLCVGEPPLLHVRDLSIYKEIVIAPYPKRGERDGIWIIKRGSKFSRFTPVEIEAHAAALTKAMTEGKVPA